VSGEARWPSVTVDHEDDYRVALVPWAGIDVLFLEPQADLGGRSGPAGADPGRVRDDGQTGSVDGGRHKGLPRGVEIALPPLRDSS
jgi:hypothetical protein